MKFLEEIHIMRESYYELERRFVEISRVIPFDNPGDTYSPRLYDILQTSCGQVENLMRIICDELGLNYGNNPHFMDYYKTLNNTGVLELQAIDYFPAPEFCIPFVLEKQTEPPVWWKAYNKTKHNLPIGYKEGNLKNTVLALSAVYTLHCIAVYCDKIGDKVLNKEKWKEEEKIRLKILQPNMETIWDDYDVRPHSTIFHPISYYLIEKL